MATGGGRYQEVKATSDTICLAERVRSACPVACQTLKPCFQPKKAPAPVHQIWERVMHLRPNEGETEVVCVRSGLETAAVEECRRLRTAGDLRSYPPPFSTKWASWHRYIEAEGSQQVPPQPVAPGSRRNCRI